MEARLREFVGDRIARNESHIVALGNMSGICHAYGECLAGKDILRRFVPRADAQ